MPFKRKLRRRPPTDAQALRAATDPRIVRNVFIALGVLLALGAGLVLVARGMF